MRRDNIRIYAVEAFRFYAKIGRVSAEEYRHQIYEHAAGCTDIVELKDLQGANAVNEAKGALYDIQKSQKKRQKCA